MLLTLEFLSGFWSEFESEFQKGKQMVNLSFWYIKDSHSETEAKNSTTIFICI